MLPKLFLDKMKALLSQDEFAALSAALEQAPLQALRVNTCRGSAEKLLQQLPFVAEPVPWCRTGYRYAGDARPGKHVLHEAGAYYIQEPSAMAVAENSGAIPGERILDLCAAPGGKSTHLACLTGDTGLLVCNEIIPDRAQTLARNIERMGLRSAVVTNHSPAEMAARFAGFFDRILVDAPCSGEGMFRKNPLACEEWSPANVQMCAARQAEILDCACRMLRPGGTLVYSTCTFSPEEDERTVAALLDRHNELELEMIPEAPGFSRGRPEWADGRESLRRTVRIFPHLAPGEGHFLAKFHSLNPPASFSSVPASAARRVAGGAERQALDLWEGFCREVLGTVPAWNPTLFGERLFVVPAEMPPLNGIRIVRPGLELGRVGKGRFEPAHALAMTLQSGATALEASLDPDTAGRYLAGETFEVPLAGKGWCLVTCLGYSLGWGKLVDGTLKNHYPKGLRRQL